MTGALLAIVLLASVAPAAEDERQLVASQEDEPAYKVLFESGYYEEAVEYLRGVSDSSDTNWRERQTYLAFSLIMTGQRDSAIGVFTSILWRDSTYKLDPIMTSPKLFKVYHMARSRWEKNREPVDSSSTASPPPDTTAQQSDSPPTPEVSTNNVVPTVPRDWYRVPMYAVPPAGQFYNRRIPKGIALLLLQTGGIAASVWAHNKRWEYYQDPGCGWCEENLEENRRYSALQRSGFAIFALSYLYGVVDAAVDGRRQRREQDRKSRVGQTDTEEEPPRDTAPGGIEQ